MSAATFNTITADDWRRMFAAHRAQGHFEGTSLLRRIRAAMAAKSLSRPGTGRACVRLELARAAEHLADAQARSNSPSMSLNGNLPNASGERGIKTACTEAELRAGNILSAVAGSLVGDRSADDRRGKITPYAEAGGSANFEDAYLGQQKATERNVGACENDDETIHPSRGDKSRGGGDGGLMWRNTHSPAHAVAGPLST
jgi:hypothetical protein